MRRWPSLDLMTRSAATEVTIKLLQFHVQTAINRIQKKRYGTIAQIIGYRYPSYDNRAVIDRNLVAMAVASQNIIELVFPLPNAGEIHGLPREATILRDEPDIIVIDREHPQWDFRPWFSEKSGALKTAINELMEILEFPSSLVSAESDVERKIKGENRKQSKYDTRDD